MREFNNYVNTGKYISKLFQVQQQKRPRHYSLPTLQEDNKKML